LFSAVYVVPHWAVEKTKAKKKNKLLVQATTYSLVMEYEFISVTNKQSREIVIILFHCIVAPTF
jgi:hypothetical protein